MLSDNPGLVNDFQSTSLSRGKTQIRAASFSVTYALSIHFPLTREDWPSLAARASRGLSIHFPLTREDLRHRLPERAQRLSIHFPLTREDHPGRGRAKTKGAFQSTSLSRGKTSCGPALTTTHSLSIHFPLTREDGHEQRVGVVEVLSIHFPLTREDCFPMVIPP